MINMPNDITLKSVRNLLGMKFFIPSYQRGYRWTEQQVKDLLNDIKEFIDNGTNNIYCIQPLVVKERDQDILSKIKKANSIDEVKQFYNPQNEMFRRFRTKCSIFQNETYLRESFSLPINQIKKHRKNLLLRCFFIACLNEGGRCIPSQCHCKAVITAFYYAAEFVHGPSLRLYNIMSV